ncbi:hypothetical protein IWQ62_004384 [Dispira parvispora]|uniref:Uncharacterized protein n=1 Tax=Dispira parvispora TaxID=1520584 RepID=A0A9W8E5N6_9FUNG|nr:hypothetical protein IWQ62_004384 [Dispira parvispora]
MIIGYAKQNLELTQAITVLSAQLAQLNQTQSKLMTDNVRLRVHVAELRGELSKKEPRLNYYEKCTHQLQTQVLATDSTSELTSSVVTKDRTMGYSPTLKSRQSCCKNIPPE